MTFFRRIVSVSNRLVFQVYDSVHFCLCAYQRSSDSPSSVEVRHFWQVRFTRILTWRIMSTIVSLSRHSLFRVFGRPRNFCFVDFLVSSVFKYQLTGLTSQKVRMFIVCRVLIILASPHGGICLRRFGFAVLADAKPGVSARPALSGVV